MKNILEEKNIKVKKLYKDVNLITIKENKFKTNLISVVLERPLEREEITLNTLLTEVIKKGSRKYPTTTDIQRKSKEMYNSVFFTNCSKKAERHELEFSLVFPNDRYLDESIFDEADDFLISMILDPLVEDGGFSKKIVDLEKENLRLQIMAEINDKSSLALNRLLENMCEGERYGLNGLGYLQDLDSIDEKKLYEHYRKVISTSKIKIFAEGDVDVDRIAKIFVEKFKVDRSETVKIEREKYIRDKGEISYVEDVEDVTQARLLIGLAGNTDIQDAEKYFPLQLGNYIFGGGASSLLFNNVREENSLCYSIGSGIHQLKSLIIIAAGIDYKNYKKALDLILLDLDRMKNGDFSDVDIENAKSMLTNSYSMATDAIAGKTNFINGEIISNTFRTPEYVIECINKVTREEIIEAFKNVNVETVYLMRGEM